MAAMRAQAERFGSAPRRRRHRPRRLLGAAVPLWARGTEYRAQAVIIATGASALWLGLDSETRLRGRGVSACATCDGFFFRDREIAVVGGGDTAFEEATYLTRFATEGPPAPPPRHVPGLEDHGRPGPRAPEDRDPPEHRGRGGPRRRPRSTALRLRDTRDRRRAPRCRSTALFIAIGYRPNTEAFRDWLEVDETGYLVVHDETGSKIDGVFIAGDVHDHRYRQAVTAAGRRLQGRHRRRALARSPRASPRPRPPPPGRCARRPRSCAVPARATPAGHRPASSMPARGIAATLEARGRRRSGSAVSARRAGRRARRSGCGQASRSRRFRPSQSARLRRGATIHAPEAVPLGSRPRRVRDRGSRARPAQAVFAAVLESTMTVWSIAGQVLEARCVERDRRRCRTSRRSGRIRPRRHAGRGRTVNPAASSSSTAVTWPSDGSTLRVSRWRQGHSRRCAHPLVGRVQRSRTCSRGLVERARAPATSRLASRRSGTSRRARGAGNGRPFAAGGPATCDEVGAVRRSTHRGRASARCIAGRRLARPRHVPW